MEEGSPRHPRSHVGESNLDDCIEHLDDARAALRQCWWLINFLVGGDMGRVDQAIRVYDAMQRGELVDEINQGQMVMLSPADDSETDG